VLFDQNTLAGEWRAQARCCAERNVVLDRDVAFALAVADLLELPDDLPLMPAVTAAMSVPICLRDPASLARVKAEAWSAARLCAPTRSTR
jgi:hypothetical protein